MSRQAFEDWLTRKTPPNGASLLLLKQEFGVSTDWLLGDADAPMHTSEWVRGADLYGALTKEVVRLGAERVQAPAGIREMLTEMITPGAVRAVLERAAADLIWNMWRRAERRGARDTIKDWMEAGRPHESLRDVLKALEALMSEDSLARRMREGKLGREFRAEQLESALRLEREREALEARNRPKRKTRAAAARPANRGTGAKR